MDLPHTGEPKKHNSSSQMQTSAHHTEPVLRVALRSTLPMSEFVEYAPTNAAINLPRSYGSLLPDNHIRQSQDRRMMA